MESNSVGSTGWRIDPKRPKIEHLGVFAIRLADKQTKEALPAPARPRSSLSLMTPSPAVSHRPDAIDCPTPRNLRSDKAVRDDKPGRKHDERRDKYFAMVLNRSAEASVSLEWSSA